MAAYAARLVACSMHNIRTSCMLGNRFKQWHRTEQLNLSPPEHSIPLQLHRFRSAKTAAAAAVPADSVLTSDHIAPPANERLSADRNLKQKTQDLSDATDNVNAASQPVRTNLPQIEPPAPDGSATKTFSPKIQKLVDEIAKLTLLEVSQLNELMKKTFNIPDQPIMPAGMMAAMPKAGGDAGEADDAEGGGKKKIEKTAFSVKLTKFDEAKKIALIKEIKNNVEGLNLVQAKKFVESAPQVVKADLDKETAQKLKATLEAAGATITIE